MTQAWRFVYVCRHEVVFLDAPGVQGHVRDELRVTGNIVETQRIRALCVDKFIDLFLEMDQCRRSLGHLRVAAKTAIIQAANTCCGPMSKNTARAKRNSLVNVMMIKQNLQSNDQRLADL